jgi:hypothetical protein
MKTVSTMYENPAARTDEFVILRGRLPARTLRRLDIQGFDTVDETVLAGVGRWRRLAFILCASLAAAGTALASPVILLVLAPIAAIAGASPIHPFDLIYNHGVRYLTGTEPLPRRGPPSRFACGVGALWLVATAWAFLAGHATVGYALGASLSSVALLVATTDICVPSMIFRKIFGPPRPRGLDPAGANPVG